MAAESSKRTRLLPEARRAQLVAIAVELLLTGPLEQVTVEEVATRAGVSRGLIFHYFPTMRDLHLAALRVAADALVAHLVASTGEGPPSERFANGVDAFVGFIEQQPRTFDVLSAMAASDAEFGLVFQSVREQAALLVVEAIGGQPSPLRSALILGWVAFVETVVRSWVANPAGIERDALIEALLAGAVALITPEH